MKYGKSLRREIEKSFPQWRAQFLAYKQLKKQLKVNNYRPNNGRQSQSQRWSRFWDARKSFSRLLGYEFDKVNTFYFDKEEDHIIRLKELQVRAENLKSNQEKLDVQKDILEFHAEMVLLLHYSVLNFTGFIKIVKKYNKRMGTSFQFSRMARVMEQSFFSTDLLCRLMEDCESMLCTLSEEDNGHVNPSHKHI